MAETADVMEEYDDNGCNSDSGHYQLCVLMWTRSQGWIKLHPLWLSFWRNRPKSNSARKKQPVPDTRLVLFVWRPWCLTSNCPASWCGTGSGAILPLYTPYATHPQPKTLWTPLQTSTSDIIEPKVHFWKWAVTIVRQLVTASVAPEILLCSRIRHPKRFPPFALWNLSAWINCARCRNILRRISSSSSKLMGI